MKYYFNFKAAMVLFFLFLFLNSCSQPKSILKKDVYPKVYSFEKAKEFVIQGDIDIAIWYYINLFPENKQKVIGIVKELATKVDSVNFGWKIKTAFGIHSTFDPSVFSAKNGSFNIDVLAMKGAWGDELIQKITPMDKPLGSASEYNFRGLDLYEAEDYHRAIIAFNSAVEIKPTAAIYFNRGMSYMEINDYIKAEEDFSSSLSIDDKLIIAYFNRGQCRINNGKLPLAITDLSKVLINEPNNWSAYNIRGYANYLLDQFTTAKIDFDNVIKLNPEFAGAYYYRGLTKHKFGEIAEACLDLSQALKLGFPLAEKALVDFCK